MPPRYAKTHPQVRDQILARVAAGERLMAVCAEPGMPCGSSVARWARTETEFGEAYRLARRQGAWRRLYGYDEEVAAAFVARLAAGARMDALMRAPDLPGRRTVAYWRATGTAFAGDVARLVAEKGQAKAARLRGRYRPYDPVIGERIYVRLWKGEGLRAVLRSEAAFPSRAVLARWRRENPEFDAQLRFVLGGWRRKRGRARTLWSEALQDEIFALIVQGHSLRSLSRLAGMPSQKALYNWCRERPQFAAMVERACVYREDWYHDHMLEAAERAVPGEVAAAKREIGRLSKQLTRLRKRPGWKRRSG
jgi:hypothetical protein